MKKGVSLYGQGEGAQAGEEREDQELDGVPQDGYESEVQEFENFRAHNAAMAQRDAEGGRPRAAKAPEQQPMPQKEEDDAESLAKKQERARLLAERRADEGTFDILMSGTSATLVIQLPKRAHIGWVGDSQATVWGSGRSAQVQATQAHRPDVEVER